MVKNLPAMWETCVGDLGLIPGLGRSPGGRHGNPLQYSWLENPHGQRSPEGWSPWGHRESDRAEQLSTHARKPPLGLLGDCLVKEQEYFETDYFV